MSHALNLSARLAILEEEVGMLHELRRQRAELDRRIEAGEDAEQLLRDAESILLPLLDGEQPKAQRAVDDTPAEEKTEGPPIDDEPREVTPEEFEKRVLEADVQEPAPADAADDQEPEEEDAPYRSAHAITADWVREQSPTLEFTAADVAASTGVKEATIKHYLRQLEKDAEVERIVGRTGPFQYRRAAPNGFRPEVKSEAIVLPPTPPLPPMQAAAHVQEDLPLSPIPAKLSTDECSLFDALRRVPLGMGSRLLEARLNWGNSRVGRVLQRLTELGYVGRNGDLYRVIPEELRGDVAAD